MKSCIEFLESWNADQCNDTWEHEFGISIETVDNPGWVVTIALKETRLSGRPFPSVDISTNEADWLRCWVDNDVFNIASGPTNLSHGLGIFAKWADLSTDKD